MSNDLSTLNGFLDTQLVDTTDTVWASAEKNNILTWAVAGLWPRLSVGLNPTDMDVTLETGTYYYDLPDGVMSVSSVEWLDTNDDPQGFLVPGTWHLSGDPILGTGVIHVSPTIADQGGTLYLHGYGRYDVTANYIPDDYVPLVLATARAEAYRRIAGDRVRYKEWQARQQVQNVSVNELVELVNEADREVVRLRSMFKTWQRPTAARV